LTPLHLVDHFQPNQVGLVGFAVGVAQFIDVLFELVDGGLLSLWVQAIIIIHHEHSAFEVVVLPELRPWDAVVEYPQ
jgi:hypothetical protein